MKLYLLRPVKNLPKERNPWEPWYDKAHGFIVRATNEESARRIAAENAGDEAWGRPKTEVWNPWLLPEYSTCTELTYRGEAGMIIKDYQAA